MLFCVTYHHWQSTVVKLNFDSWPRQYVISMLCGSKHEFEYSNGFRPNNSCSVKRKTIWPWHKRKKHRCKIRALHTFGKWIIVFGLTWMGLRQYGFGKLAQKLFSRWINLERATIKTSRERAISKTAFFANLFQVSLIRIDYNNYLQQTDSLWLEPSGEKNQWIHFYMHNWNGHEKQLKEFF